MSARNPHPVYGTDSDQIKYVQQSLIDVGHLTGVPDGLFWAISDTVLITEPTLPTMALSLSRMPRSSAIGLKTLTSSTPARNRLMMSMMGGNILNSSLVLETQIVGPWLLG